MNSKYTPVLGKLLVEKYGEEVKITKVIKELDEEKNKDKDPRTDMMETKDVEKELPSNFQLAKVVAVPVYPEGYTFTYKVGDVIAYKYGACLSLDLEKDTYIIDAYQVVALLNG
jgi:hypothetical protein